MGLYSMKVTTGQSSSVTGRLSRRWVGVQRTRHRRFVNRPFVGQENQRPWSLRHGKRRGSSLPPWYPRTPLRDITAIVKAIERKRAKLRDDETAEASQTETDILAPKITLDDINISTSITEACQVKEGEDGENCTPQKTVLDSIEEVRKIWLQNQRQHKTPEAKEAERKRKMRVLRSMR